MINSLGLTDPLPSLQDCGLHLRILIQVSREAYHKGQLRSVCCYGKVLEVTSGHSVYEWVVTSGQTWDEIPTHLHTHAFYTLMWEAIGYWCILWCNIPFHLGKLPKQFTIHIQKQGQIKRAPREKGFSHYQMVQKFNKKYNKSSMVKVNVSKNIDMMR